MKIAEACGVEGVKVEQAEELAEVVSNAAQENRSLVVEIPIEVSSYHGLV